jgi:G-patch domain
VASTLASGIHAGKVSWQVTLNSHHILWLIEHSSVEFNKLLIQRNRDLSYNPARQPIIITPPTEAEVYACDMALLPDIPTLETQARIPIEDFGMGVLLGLSWKPGANLQGNKIDPLKDQRQRPTALGLGLEDEEF